jgi:hypothetical protein
MTLIVRMLRGVKTKTNRTNALSVQKTNTAKTREERSVLLIHVRSVDRIVIVPMGKRRSVLKTPVKKETSRKNANETPIVQFSRESSTLAKKTNV